MEFRRERECDFDPSGSYVNSFVKYTNIAVTTTIKPTNTHQLRTVASISAPGVDGLFFFHRGVNGFALTFKLRHDHAAEIFVLAGDEYARGIEPQPRKRRLFPQNLHLHAVATQLFCEDVSIARIRRDVNFDELFRHKSLPTTNGDTE
jgi:hypothetical protein